MSHVEEQFPTWRRIKLGVSKTPGHYIESLKAGGFQIGFWGRQALTKTFCAQNEIEVDLVKVTARNLGFTEVPSRAAFFEKAATFGLMPCVAEVGPAARRQYPDQPLKEHLFVAMEESVEISSVPQVFSVDNDGGDLWLGARPDSDRLRELDNIWLFSRAKTI